MNLTRRVLLKLTALLFWRSASSSAVAAQPDAICRLGKTTHSLIR